ncbi:MAG: DUF2252 domain-containing protein [Candidatus Nanopelagicales bacterium]
MKDLQHVEHLTPAERADRGKAARKRVPRTSQAYFDPPSDRPDPVSLLESQSATRLQQLIPIRYGRMMQTAFTFYRGAALVMAADLAETPNSGLSVQACGDAHLMNFGAFASPERALVFDINDFDETNPGPWEWDLKRLTASLEVAARDRGFTDPERRVILLAATKQYRDSMANFAGMPQLEIWYARLDIETLVENFAKQASKTGVKRARRQIAKAQTRDSVQAFSKFTQVVDGERRIVSSPPLIVNVRDLMQQEGVDGDQVIETIGSVLRSYRSTLQFDRRHLLEQFEFTDLALKVVGVGSVGTRCWMALFRGRDTEDPLFLQVKEAQESVLERFTSKSEFRTSGERVVAGQRLMQSASDIFLGWDHVSGLDGVSRSFYVRQLRDWKGSAVIDAMEPSDLAAYGRICAWTLAKAHARSGDAIALSTYMGKSDRLDNAIADFSQAYADQNEKDHDALVAAVKSGRITAEQGI